MTFNLDAYLTPILNILIPLGVVGVLVWICYRCFQKPIDKLKDYISGINFSGKKSKEQNNKGIVYE